MTKTKLEIIGPYTPEHEGPFCTRDGKPVRIICTDRKTNDLDDCCVVALIRSGTRELTREFSKHGKFAINDHAFDLMNAREVPVVREFWVTEHFTGNLEAHNTKEDAIFEERSKSFLRTIHVREVMPGEDA